MSAIGRRRWAIAAGGAPSRATGPEPAFTSRDQLALLNTGPALANARIRVVYAHRETIAPFRIAVSPRRMRIVRINDLIFPEAVRLDEPYGLVLECDVPIVVQFTRQDTRERALAGFVATACPL